MATPPTKNLGVQNWFQTTLAQSCGATDTTIYLNATPVPTEGYLIIDPDNPSTREVIHYTSVGGGSVTLPSVADRGLDGTTGQTHAQNVTVRMEYTSSHFTAIQSGNALLANALATFALYANNSIPLTALAVASIFDPTNGIKSFVNTGSAGGTWYYMNMGGLKAVWGASTTASQNNATSINYSVNFPSGFFSASPQLAINNSAAASNTSYLITSMTNVNASIANMNITNQTSGVLTASQYGLFIGI